MLTRHITLACQNEDCRKTYEVPDSGDDRTKDMILELAVCPWCNQPRTHNFYRRDVKQCPECHFWKYLWAFWGYHVCGSCRLMKYRSTVKGRKAIIEENGSNTEAGARSPETGDASAQKFNGTEKGTLRKDTRG
jgi:hypothetical protein